MHREVGEIEKERFVLVLFDVVERLVGQSVGQVVALLPALREVRDAAPQTRRDLPGAAVRAPERPVVGARRPPLVAGDVDLESVTFGIEGRDDLRVL